MTGQDRQKVERAISAKGRVVALVIAGTMIVWLAGTALVPWAGLPARFIFLFDLAAIAAFVWVFANIWQIWRLRQSLNTNGQG